MLGKPAAKPRRMTLWSLFSRLQMRSGCLFTVPTLAAISPAGSQPVLELRWDAPSHCPQSDAVQDRIRAMVGSTEVSTERLRAEGKVIRIGDKYRLDLLITSGSASGTRVIESDSCDHLAGAAAVALGLLVRVARINDAPLTNEDLAGPGLPNQDVNRTAQRGPKGLSGSDFNGNQAKPSNAQREQTGNGSASQKPHESKPGEAGANQTAAQPARAAIKVRVRAPVIDAGLLNLPGLSLGYGIGLGTSYGSWQAILTGLYWPQRTVSSQWLGYGAEVTRYSADFDVCRAWQWGKFEWAPCLRGGLVHEVARGTGAGIVHSTASASVPLVGGVFTSKLYAAQWAALFFVGSVEAQTSRPRLLTEGIGEIYRYPVAALKFGLGSEWIF